LFFGFTKTQTPIFPHPIFPPARKGRSGPVRNAQKSKKVVACVAEDKSPRESWLIPRPPRLGIWLWAALIAKRVFISDLRPRQAEYAIRGFRAGNLPLGMRRFVSKGVNGRGRFLPYYYCTIKLKCFGGEGGSTFEQMLPDIQNNRMKKEGGLVLRAKPSCSSGPQEEAGKGQTRMQEPTPATKRDTPGVGKF
jgi:hypothetical protein